MVQIELGEELESRLVAAAFDSGVSVDQYVRLGIEPMLPAQVTPSTLEERRATIAKLKTFAQDHGIRLAPGVTVKDLINESRP